ncbi:MAG TPA: YhjD/YihY/BrkB family envelope integrity protein [Candidatus Paceibacterota bacterium]|nr:YhjD/YihY/BrkB family envelope integrity protein [Candidatus Paceibacterota bacterium]HMO83171.1 YhjD/YihY/BrkB family envelope integrity protein [Candidatus Paceibacterota bacterium]
MRFFKLLYQSAKLWIENDMVYYAAAFSYYAPLALIPLILISLTMVGLIYGQEFTAQIFNAWGETLGTDLVKMLGLAVDNLTIATNSYSVPVVGIIFFSTICLVALNVLSTAFQRLRGVVELGFINWLKRSLRSAIFIVILQLYLIGIIAIEIFLSLIELPASGFISQVGFGLSSVIFFSVLYRFLYSDKPSVKGSVVGGIIAAILFMGAKHAVYLTLLTTPSLNFYGAAGLILVLLIWVYILAAILLYGAAIATTYDKIYLEEKSEKNI